MQPAAIPASQLSLPVMSPHAVRVRVLAGQVCATKSVLEPHQQIISGSVTNVKFIVILKDEFENDADVLSLLAKQRQKQHELLCFLEPDGSSGEYFFAFARYNNQRNLPLKVEQQYPNLTLNHQRSKIEESSVSVYFAMNSGCGLLATYYSSTSLAAPVATRLAASIDFSGSSLSSQPVSSLVSGVGWSVRWSGFVRAPVAGGATWTFFIGLAQGGNGGDGVRGWVDGVAVVDGWGGIAGSEVSGTVVLSGASNSYYEVVVEYKAVGAAYGCTLSWQSSSFSKVTAISSRFMYNYHTLATSNISVLSDIASGSVSSFFELDCP